MSQYPYFVGAGAVREEALQALPRLDLDALYAPEGYVAGRDLVAAVNVALALGMPLLLTGEPGTGKTQLADCVAHELGLGRAVRFETKSTTEARDLFYRFDTVGRFHAAQTGAAETEPLAFVQYQALGLALLYASEREAVAAVLPPSFEHPGPQRSVVLIDEIDKSPRDVPNDILNEIDSMFFRVPELGAHAEIRPPAHRRPIVIITSNSERALPDAFLRRCIYHHIEFPDDDQLRRIVESRVGRRFVDRDDFVKDALALFRRVRSPANNLRKKPGVAELLNWLCALAEPSQRPLPGRLADHPSLVDTARCCLFKTREDQEAATRLLASDATL